MSWRTFTAALAVLLVVRVAVSVGYNRGYKAGGNGLIHFECAGKSDYNDDCFFSFADGHASAFGKGMDLEEKAYTEMQWKLAGVNQQLAQTQIDLAVCSKRERKP